jgi:hypothetical protein
VNPAAVEHHKSSDFWRSGERNATKRRKQNMDLRKRENYVRLLEILLITVSLGVTR